jgi:hypothetical protein
VQAHPRIGASPFVFTLDGKQPVSFGRAKRNFIDRSGVKDWRMHDLRRTARTLLSRAGVDVDVAERCLGHALAGVRATYDRHSFEREMRAAFEKLAALIERTVNPPANVVTPMRRKRCHLRRCSTVSPRFFPCSMRWSEFLCSGGCCHLCLSWQCEPDPRQRGPHAARAAPRRQRRASSGDGFRRSASCGADGHFTAERSCSHT